MFEAIVIVDENKGPYLKARLTTIYYIISEFRHALDI